MSQSTSRNMPGVGDRGIVEVRAAQPDDGIRLRRLGRGADPGPAALDGAAVELELRGRVDRVLPREGLPEELLGTWPSRSRATARSRSRPSRS